MFESLFLTTYHESKITRQYWQLNWEIKMMGSSGAEKSCGVWVTELILHGLAPHMDLGQVLISNPLDIFANQIFAMLALY